MQGTVETRIPYLTSLSYLQAQSFNQENTKSQEMLKKTVEHISTGLRVIDASDDLAGFAIADRFDVQIQGMSKALQNTNEALSAARIAEGALTEYIDILGYMKELAENASHSSLEHSDRVTLQEEISNFQERLKSISEDTNFMGRNLLDGSYQSQHIQVGQNIGQVMKISLRTARPDQLGLYEVVSAGEMNNAGNFRGSIYAAIDNGVTSLDSVTIQGFMGAEYIEISDYSSAKQIAESVNAKSDLTGVEAKAGTYAKIYNLSRTGDLTFKLHGSSEVDISATIESKSDLTPLYEDLESKAAASHITPKLSADKSSIYLYAEAGENIGIEDFYNPTMPTVMNFVGLEPDGKTTTGVSKTLVSEFLDSILVGGYVEFQSNEPFILFSGTGGRLFTSSSSTQIPVLKAVDNINVSLETNADEALEVIENATEYVERIRSDVQAYESGFESILQRLESSTEQMEKSKHRILDADLASETMELSSAVIQVQSQNALITQANRLIPEYSLFYFVNDRQLQFFSNLECLSSHDLN
ncbi:MAG: flagellin, partial [Candidatus Magnetoglobus multicellularis str. Araruama]